MQIRFVGWANVRRQLYRAPHVILGSTELPENQQEKALSEKRREQSIRHWQAFLRAGVCAFCDYRDLQPNAQKRAKDLFHQLMKRHVKRNINGDDYSE